MKKTRTKIKSYVCIGSISILAGCGGGGGDPVMVAEAPVTSNPITNPPVMPPAPPPPNTMPPVSGPATPPVTGPINLPGAPTPPPAPPPPAPAPPPATGSTSKDYSWLYDSGDNNSEAIVVAKLDIKENVTSQANPEFSVEEMRKQMQEQMEAERIAMEQYHKKQMDELMALKIKMKTIKAIKDKLDQNVEVKWMGMQDGLSVLNFDKLNTPGEEALPCDYSHMAFIKDEKLGVVNLGEIIDWTTVEKPENNYNGWFFVMSPFAFNEDLRYFKGVDDETHLLWARRISDKELVVKPAGSPWNTSEQFKAFDGYKNVRVSYNNVALPVLAIDRLILKPMEKVGEDTCPAK